MSFFVHILLIGLALLAINVRESEAGCGCCCHCCKCCSCCTPCCNPPLLIKLPRTCPCCCKCCCPCCCCGGGGRKRRDVRLLWKRAVPFPQVHLPGEKCNCGTSECDGRIPGGGDLAIFKRQKRQSEQQQKELLSPLFPLLKNGIF